MEPANKTDAQNKVTLEFSLAKNIAFRKPIFLVYITLFALLCISAVIVVIQSREILTKYSSTLETVSGKLELLLNIRKNAEQIKSAVVGYAIHSDPNVYWEEEKSIYNLSISNKKNWDTYRLKIEDNEEKLLFDSVIFNERLQSGAWEKVITMKKAIGLSEIKDPAFHKLMINPGYTRYQYYISALSDNILKGIHTEGKKIEDKVLQSRRKIILFTILAFCLLLMLGILILNAIRELQNDNRLLNKQDKLISDQKLLFEGILSAAPDGIIGVDEGGKIFLFNKQAETMFGYTGEEILGSSPEKIISFDRGNSSVSCIMKYFTGFVGSKIEHTENELYGLGESGIHFPIEISLGNIQTGNSVCFILVVRDVTKRKIAENELKEKNTVLKSLTGYLQNVREEERKYLAREVHDELGQLASALKIDIDWFGIKMENKDETFQNRIQHANKTIAVLITTIRKIASGLRPSVLDDFGLNAALHWQCTEFQNLNGIPCIFNEGFNDTNLSTEIKTEVFRMVQEAMTNVMRHAKAGTIIISAHEDEQNLYISITDDGVGFDLDQRKNTLGLIGLRERALSVNGKLIIESIIGKGTVINIVLPK